MNISYSRPLELGWQRMKRALFQPFDLGRWMVLGFTAWLAQLADGGSGGSGGQDGLNLRHEWDDDGVRESFGGAWSWLTDIVGSPVGVVLVALVAVTFLVIVALILWISSRGRFMFLDNLVHGRTEVTHPWREFQAEGDSLFLWRVVYTIIVLLVIGTLIGGFLLLVVPAAAWDLHGSWGLLAAIGLGMTLFVVIVVLAYIEYFLQQFVVPIMHKHRVGTTEAWGIFLPVLRTHPGPFVLFGLFYLAIIIGLSIAYAIAGVLTCCLGLLLLALPYLGAVVTLPMSVLGRFMNLEFLAQFGDDFNLLSPLPDPNLPQPTGPGSGDFDADGTMVRTENVSEDAGTDESGTQDR